MRRKEQSVNEKVNGYNFMEDSKLKHNIFIATFLFFATLFLSNQSHAAKLRFGPHEKIHHINDIALTGSDGEELYLGRLVYTYFVGAGAYMRDDGFVIGIKNKKDAFYPMPTGEELSDLQAEGLLPSSLPDFEFTLVDYLLGYSLYILIIGLALFHGIKYLFQRKRSSKSAS